MLFFKSYERKLRQISLINHFISVMCISSKMLVVEIRNTNRQYLMKTWPGFFNLQSMYMLLWTLKGILPRFQRLSETIDDQDKENHVKHVKTKRPRYDTDDTEPLTDLTQGQSSNAAMQSTCNHGEKSAAACSWTLHIHKRSCESNFNKSL